MRTEIAGEAGLIKLTAACIATFVLMTVLQGLWSQWLWGMLALIAAWRFAVAINR